MAWAASARVARRSVAKAWGILVWSMIPTDLPSGSSQMLRLCVPSISMDSSYSNPGDTDSLNEMRRKAVVEPPAAPGSLRGGLHKARNDAAGDAFRSRRRLARRFHDHPLPFCNLDVFAAFAGLHSGARKSSKQVI